MRPIKDKNLAELLIQLRFSPEAKRRRQLDAAEELLPLIDPSKEYPFEFVYFKITGFHLKASIQPYALKGDALRDDLRIFTTKFSAQVAQSVHDLHERVYAVEDLARSLGISTKTIQRWRTRGLVARKFILDDGNRRLGFSQSAVDSFLQADPQRLTRARQFNRLTAAQRQEVVRRAKALAASTALSRHRIISQIAAETGRAHETLRYTLRDHELAHPKDPIFRRPAGVVSPAQAARLHDLYRQGTQVRELMGLFHRSRSSVYRIVHQRRALALMARKIRFVPSDDFLDEAKRRQILSEPIDLPRPPASSGFDTGAALADDLLPEYLAILKDTPILHADTELALFRKYNCLKFLAHEARQGISLSRVSSRQLSELERYLDEEEAIEKLIVEANLRLVVGIAGKHASSGTPFAELVSKGNFALIHAVQEFDYSKGFRFGKWAAMAIAKEYAKTSGKSTELSRQRAASIGAIQKQLRGVTDVAALERTRQSLTQVIQNELDDREQYVILHHFGLIGSGIKRKTKTLQQIGEELELTKERIRQIELVALQKLRQCLSSEQFELLVG